MKFYMLYHYTYDGCGGHDQSPLKPCSTSEKGKEALKKIYDDEPDYDWQDDGNGFHIVIRRQGRYAYDYFALQEMTMDEECDW